MISIKDIPSVANNLKDYYKNIINNDQQLALGTNQSNEQMISKTKLQTNGNKVESKSSYLDIVMQEAQPEFQGISSTELLEQVPPESRVTLNPLPRIVIGTRSRTQSTKELGTLRSRQKHFIIFYILIN